LLEVTRSPSLFHDRGREVRSFFGRSGGSAGLPPFAQDDPTGALHKGSRVRHPTLGPGVVLETDGEGENAKLTIYFDRSGKRRLLARYANLESL
jgi:hypothetical protein